MTRSCRRTGCAPTPAAPVTVRQLAAFHTQGNTATFFWHNKASTTTSTVLTHVGVDGQSILPRKNDAGNTVAPGHLHARPAPSGSRSTPSGATRPATAAPPTTTNGCPTTSQCGHHLRIWPAKDRSGAVIANTYLVSMDYSGINYDYNDNVYLVSNMKPETATDPSAPGLVPGASALQLEFDAAVAGTLADKDGQGTGFRSTQPNERDVTVGSDSYLASPARPRHHGRWLAAGDQQRHRHRGHQRRQRQHAGQRPAAALRRHRRPVQRRRTDRRPGHAVRRGLRAGGRPARQRPGQLRQGRGDREDGGRHDRPGHRVPRRAGRHRHHDRHAGAHPHPGRRHQRRRRAARRPGRAHRQGGLPHQRRRLDRAADRVQRAGVLRGQAVRRAFVRRPARLPQGRSAARRALRVLRRSSSGNATGGTPAAREALLRLDTGSSTTYTDSASNVWAADTGRFTPTTAPNEGIRTDAIAGTTEDPLYATYRGNIGRRDAAHADLHAAHQGRDQGRPAAALRRAGRRQQHGRQAPLRHRRRGRDRAPELRHLRGRGRSQHRHGAAASTT